MNSRRIYDCLLLCLYPFTILSIVLSALLHLTGIYQLFLAYSIKYKMRKKNRLVKDKYALNGCREPIVLVLEYPEPGWNYSHLWIFNNYPSIDGACDQDCRYISSRINIDSGDAMLLCPVTGDRYLQRMIMNSPENMTIIRIAKGFEGDYYFWGQ